MIELIKIWWSRFKANRVRNIPNSYFKGYRRLADSIEDTERPTLNKCSTCRHAVAYVTWHCDRKDGCKWERCYVKTELTKADLMAGHAQFPASRWIKLPEK